ncbi:hypothetical protein YC2023_052602 [Brassica napus]
MRVWEEGLVFGETMICVTLEMNQEPSSVHVPFEVNQCKRIKARDIKTNLRVGVANSYLKRYEAVVPILPRKDRYTFPLSSFQFVSKLKSYTYVDGRLLA